MVNESSQPKPGDAVLGGNNPPPIGAAVLGGIEGVKQRCASPDFQTRIGGLQEAVKYGEAGIELLLHGLKDEVSEVALLAYSLLQENVEPELKRALEICEPRQQNYVRSPIDSCNEFTCTALSPNGQLLAGGSEDNTIKLCNVETGTLTATLSGHSGRIYSVAFSPNGQILVSGSEDNTIKLWDVETGTLKTTLSRHSSLNTVDPVALFHSYLEIKQPKNSSLYEAIQLLNSGTKAEKEAVFSRLKSRLEPVIQSVLWSYINALEPQVADTYKWLKYFLALDRWREAKEESEKILLLELGCKKVKAINRESTLSTLENISRLWKGYSNLYPSLIQVDFFKDLQTQIVSIHRLYDPREPHDHFSQRCYHETHE